MDAKQLSLFIIHQNSPKIGGVHMDHQTLVRIVHLVIFIFFIFFFFLAVLLQITVMVTVMIEEVWPFFKFLI
jgi:hypothetical protein